MLKKGKEILIKNIHKYNVGWFSMLVPTIMCAVIPWWSCMVQNARACVIVCRLNPCIQLSDTVLQTISRRNECQSVTKDLTCLQTWLNASCWRQDPGNGIYYWSMNAGSLSTGKHIKQHPDCTHSHRFVPSTLLFNRLLVVSQMFLVRNGSTTN